MRQGRPQPRFGGDLEFPEVHPDKVARHGRRRDLPAPRLGLVGGWSRRVSTDLEDVVQDDVVELWVTCMGSTTYQTAIGGSQTVPYFLVGKVKRYATAS
ncbi:hypothetical protein ACFVYT_34430 [Streptomyces sp. NPDC058290]|uniref:hypothetical protein n=1 Tax=Streptomyces sp. NPDC058290 TaxID=3346426 RepID=UPI0036EA27E5